MPRSWWVPFSEYHAPTAHTRLAICEEHPQRFEHWLHRLLSDVQPYRLPLASSLDKGGSRTANQVVVTTKAQHDLSLTRCPMG